MMEEWKEYRLGDVINILDYKRVPLSAKERSSRKGCYPYYGAQGVIDYIDDYIFDGTYLLIAEDGENLKSQKQNVAQLAYGKYWVNNHAHIVESNERSDIRYICYLLNTLDLSGYITGSAQPKLNQANLVNISVHLPSLEIQQKIASILSSLDKKIEVNRRINDNLEQQAQALFKSWFVDFEPFKNGEFVESELGMIPKGWRVDVLSSFGNIVCGKTPSKAESSYYGGSIPFIKIPDMHNKVFVAHSEDNLSRLGDESQIIKRLPPYSILVSCIATVGLVCMNTKEAHTNQQINSIIPKNHIYRYYLYEKICSIKDFLINLGRGGTTTLNVNTKTFSNIKILKPQDDILLKYDRLVQPLFNKIESLCNESSRLASLRDTLLPKLMSGELRVGDVGR